MAEKQIAVVGLGNILMQDEGVGVHVVRALEAEELGPAVGCFDAGTALVDLMPELEGYRKLILVDAVKADGEPGTIYRFEPKAIRPRPEEPTPNASEAKMSLHETTLQEALQMAELSGSVPEKIVIIGVEPKVIGEGLDLSEEVRESLPRVIRAIRREIYGFDKETSS